MTTLLTPKQRLLDNAGAIMPGGKVYTYATGSSTPLATYQDEALTVANTNPVVADANGFLPRIFGVKATLYRVVIKTSADVTIYTEDNVAAVELTTASVATRLKQLVACPLDYGAVGDGVANDATALQAAITAALGVVDLAGKTYKCNSTLTLKSNLEVRNGTIDFSSASNTGFSAAGTASAPVTLTASSTTRLGTVTTAAATGCAAGQLALLSSGFAMAHANNCAAEMSKIDYVATGTVLHLADRVRNQRGFLTGDTAIVTPITQLHDITLSRLTVLCGSGVGSFKAASFSYCERIAVRDCVFRPYVGGTDSSGVTFSDCYNCRVEGSRFYSTGTAGDGADTHGVVVLKACRKITIHDCDFEFIGGDTYALLHGAVRIGDWGSQGSRHGQSYETKVSRCTFNGCFWSISVWACCDDTLITGCKINDSSYNAGLAGNRMGLYLRGAFSVDVRDCQFDIDTGYGVYFSDANVITAFVPVVNISVTDCDIDARNAGAAGNPSISITGRAAAPLAKVTLRNLQRISSGIARPYVIINYVYDIDISESSMLNVSTSNVSAGKVQRCKIGGYLSMLTTTNLCVNECTFDGVSHGVWPDEGCDNIRISNCSFIGGSVAHDAILCEPGAGSVDNLTVSDCYVSGSYARPIAVGSTNYVQVTGCYLSGSANAVLSAEQVLVANCNILSTLELSGNNFSVTGCNLVSCTYAGSRAALCGCNFVNGTLTLTGAVGVSVQGCNFSSSGAHDGISLGSGCTDIQIASCSFTGGSSAYAIKLNPAAGSNYRHTISGCNIYGYLLGVYLNNTSYVSIIGNTIEATDYPIRGEGTSDYVRVSGNSVHGKATATTDTGLISFGTLQYSTIYGNFLSVGGRNRESIRVWNAIRVLFANNSCVLNADTYDNIWIAFGDTCMFSGNIIDEGRYGINYDAATVGNAHGNDIFDQATGATNGAGLTVTDAL